MTTTLQDQPLLLTERQVAQLLNCCEKTVYTLRKTGKLNCVRLMKSVRYSREDVMSFIEAQTETAEETPDNKNSPEAV
ncbi:helix-turn-helix domain-containing protein [Gimesia algae]|uniref:Helix-turn-helix domain protein n=1 Tax=Gimesia algae TaxID=2527971 RepID=A0A517V847_9PLAN|nr:helix-turn-helix domain-containing protein [Gimesia algae]QDT89152.1 Helix-turn-helix domain protein [Gimesia algae]